MRKISKISSWINHNVRKAGSKGCILGLSGGIDSAVVAALCKKAVGSSNILALILPCHSQKQDLIDAKSVAKKLKIKTKVVDLTKAYDALTSILPKGNQLARANVKPRLRMLTLYYFANNLNYLVMGTGNKSELNIGYFTKYGDGGIDLLPIGDLYKSSVREMAKKLGIPDNVIIKPPTAGLWEGQTDENEMGITYPELELIIDSLLKKKNIKHKKTKLVKTRMINSKHKCTPAPVCRF